jgi:outer membrane lipoprotein-sorting protein
MPLRRFVLRGLLSCSLTVFALAAVLAPHPSMAKAGPRKLAAEQIVAKNVAARGGLEAWRKVQTMTWMGHIESVHATVPSMQFMLAQQRPNRVRFEINALGEKTVRVFDGSQGWKLRPGHGRPEVQPYSSEELHFEQEGPGIDGVLIDCAARGSSVEVQGIDEIDKRDAYHLVVHTASGETQHVWVDAKTFLEIRYDRPARAAGGASRTVSVVYRDYKATDGLQIPSVIETGVGSGNTPDRMVIEKVLLNPPLDAQTFSEPGAHHKPHAQPQATASLTSLLHQRHRPPPRVGLLPPSTSPAGSSSAAPANSLPSGAPAPESTGAPGEDGGPVPQ